MAALTTEAADTINGMLSRLSGRHSFIWSFLAFLALSVLATKYIHQEETNGQFGSFRLLRSRISWSSKHDDCIPLEKIRCQAAETELRILRPFLGSRMSGNSNQTLVARLLVDEDPWSTIAELERAISLAPRPESFNDLAVAHLVTALERNEPESLIAALDLLEKSISSDPRNPILLFNRALVLEQMPLIAEAQAAWQNYLEVEEDSGWRSEAQTYLERLETITSGLTAGAERDRDAFLRSGLSAVQAAEFGTSAYAQAIDDLEETGQYWSATTNDPFFLEVSLWARSALSGVDRESARSAISSFVLALAAYDRRAAEAAALLSKSRDRLSAVGSPLAWAAAVFEVIATRRLLAPDGGARNLEASRQLARVNSAALDHLDYLWLQARNHWAAGTTFYLLSELSASNLEYAQAHAKLELLRDAKNATVVASLLAEGFSDTGNFDLAWQYGLKAVRSLEPSGESYQRYVVLQQLAMMARSRRFQWAGNLFQETSYQAALETKDAYLISDALTVQATILEQIDRQSEALLALEAARLVASNIQDHGNRTRALAAIDLAYGDFGDGLGAQKKVEALGRAIEGFEDLAHGPYLALAHALRADAFLKLNDTGAAEADLDFSLDFLASFGRGIENPTQRVTFLDEHRLHARLLKILLESPGSEIEALLVAETQRSSLYRDPHTSNFRSDPSALRQLVAHLQPGQGILFLHELEDRWLGWGLRPEGVELVLDVPARDMDWAISALARPPREDDLIIWQAAADALSSRIFGGLSDFLKSLKELTIIAGGSLTNLPYPGLHVPPDSVALGEHLLLSRAPSLFVEASPRSKVNSCQFARTVVSIGDPALPEGSPRLPSLPRARREAETAAKKMPGPCEAFLGLDATRTAFLNGLKNARIVHFAGHATVNPRRPWESFLLLSSESKKDGRLSARELLEEPIASRLVVLSACDSATSIRVGDSGGAVDLALPFLIRGVPEVIGVLAALDDREGERFFNDFYGELARGRSTAQALQIAQMQPSMEAGVSVNRYYFSRNVLIDRPKELNNE